MPKLTDDKRHLIKELYDTGVPVKDIIKTAGIAKQTFYTLKKTWVAEEPAEEPDQLQPPEKPERQRSVTYKMDPLEAGLDRLNPTEFPPDEIEKGPEYQPEPVYQGETRYDQSLPPNIPNTYLPGQNTDPYAEATEAVGFDNILGEFNLYDPLNMTNKITEEREKPNKPAKITIPKSLYDPKQVLKEQTREEIQQENEEKRQQCIYVIRSYVYSFKENLGLQSIIGKDDNAREKFVFQLFSKRLGDLQKLESMVKYHVRTELSGTNQMSTSLVLVACKVIEAVGARVDLRFEGLASEIQQEIDNKGQMFALLKEIEIEYNMTQYTSPKKELLFRLGLKLMEVDSKNRMIERQLTVTQIPGSNVAVDGLKHSHNEKLKDKYSDL
eukprot:m.226911 g.226911  ORF g.226911 m.226911 type:complete len:383 (+) comp25935_c1_seq12:623-1771(+)